MSYHVPALADAVRAWAAGAERAVDATVGGGGHAELLREAGATVLAADRDPEAVAAAQARLGSTGIRYVAGAFASAHVLDAVRAFRPDRILLDLGVSSRQLDATERGFTFRPGAPLDMRMEAGRAAVTAADVLNTWPADRLARAFVEQGDERPAAARRLGNEIVRRRGRAPFATSDDFVNAIRAVLGARSGPADFARLFQAIRMVVNQELEQLTAALPELRDALVPRGRLAVISYHSGEDRIVKHAFREWARKCVCPPRQPVCTCRGRPLGRVLTPKALRPPADEVLANPRARSARFRVFEVSDVA